MQTFRSAPVPLLVLVLAFWCFGAARAAGAATKIHTVSLGAARKVPYAPPDAAKDVSSEKSPALTLKVRPLLIDGRQREWTTGDTHDVTDRSFTVRRAMRINDALPSEAAARWVWQPGPWLLVDRTTGHVAALHLPDFDPMVSDVAWFRDYAAYCGVATTVRGGLYAIVAQIGARKAVVQKQIGKWPQQEHPDAICQPPKWQREPMRVTLQPTGGEPLSFNIVGTTSLIEEGDNDDQ